MSIWYRIQDGKQVGPLTDEVVREQCRTGLLKRTDQIWKEGEPAWKPVGETELGSLFPPPAPPALPSPTAKAPSVTQATSTTKVVLTIVGLVVMFIAAAKLGMLGAVILVFVVALARWLIPILEKKQRQQDKMRNQGSGE